MALGGLRREWLESRAQAIFLIRLTDEDSISRPSRIHTYVLHSKLMVKVEHDLTRMAKKFSERLTLHEKAFKCRVTND